MKILMVSIFSSHFFNWTEQLRDSGHEIYWLDVYDSNTYVKKIEFVNQISGWRYRWNYPGRYYIKKHFPGINKILNKWNQRKLEKVFEEKLKEIKPDLVHSFALHAACFPIFEVMQRNLQVKWSYSSWGSDLFFYQDQPEFRRTAKKVLSRLYFMFSDCLRDYDIAQNLGFKGEFLGVFPGRGGFEFPDIQTYIQPFETRNLILVKGFQGKHGRALNVIKSLEYISPRLEGYEVVVFGAALEVIEYCTTSSLTRMGKLEVLGDITHEEVMKFMGRSLLFIGNSRSDGMPNTLLEAIVMEVFPINSNPGGATAEIIEHGKNGFLIENPEDNGEIACLIMKGLESQQVLRSGIEFNNRHIKPTLEREYIKKQVLEKYLFIEENL